MARMDTLDETLYKTLMYFPCTEFETNPWTPLRKDLSQSKLALVSTAGLHLRGDKPFISNHKGGDSSYRVISSSANSGDILQSHTSIGFDHTAFYRDINIAFPIDRVRELMDRGVIGGLVENHYSFMGALRDTRPIVQGSGPEVAQRLKDEGADLVLLVPI